MISSLLHLVGLRPRVYYTLTNSPMRLCLLFRIGGGCYSLEFCCTGLLHNRIMDTIEKVSLQILQVCNQTIKVEYGKVQFLRIDCIFTCIANFPMLIHVTLFL